MSDADLELRPVLVNDEVVYVNRCGDLWRFNKRNNKFQRVEPTVDNTGYIHPKINGKLVSQHRIIAAAFLNLDINNPKIIVDHRNRIKKDNRVENLRLVTHQQNTFNTSAKGFYWNKQKNKWRAQIFINGKSIHLGLFVLEAEARAAYEAAKLVYHIIN
jgi:hypothetical protein